jgi:hypothetical protein
MTADIHSCSPFCTRPECVQARIADRDALAAEVARLREALRAQAIFGLRVDNSYGVTHHRCEVCRQMWPAQDRERHAPGCLAAPKEGA